MSTEEVLEITNRMEKIDGEEFAKIFEITE